MLCLAAAGCTNPLLSKPAAAEPSAEKPDLSKLRPGTHCRVGLSVVQKGGGPGHVAYTGTVSRVQGDEVTLVDAFRESGNEYGTPTAGRIPLAARTFKNKGVAVDRERVGAISIPAAEIASIEIRDPPQREPAAANRRAGDDGQ